MSIGFDVKANKRNTKSLFFILIFRLTSFFVKRKSNIIFLILGIPFRIFYKFFIQWLMGIDIAEETKIGQGFIVYHGQGLIVHGSTIIGDNVILRQNTTIGLKRDNENAPQIGNNVQVGANCVIIGDITIGANTVIGAGTIVTKSIPANSVVYGSPLIIKPGVQV